MIKKWINGDNGKVVKEIIEENFDALDHRITVLENKYVYNFISSDWSDGIISLDISGSLRDNPEVSLYLKQGNNYIPVCSGYIITNNGIELQSDLPYEGRVVIV